MTYANTLKFIQNKNLADELLETKNHILLYEADDKVWGIFNSESCNDIFEEDRGGQNLLGYSLMEVRELLKSVNVSKL